MPPRTVPAPGSSATLQHPPPFPPTWRCVRRTIVLMSRLCPGKEAEVASDDLWLQERRSSGRNVGSGLSRSVPNKRAWLCREVAGQLVSVRQADLADLLGAALGSAITGTNTRCAAALIFYGFA